MRKAFLTESGSVFAVSPAPRVAQGSMSGLGGIEVPSTSGDMADRLTSAAKFVTALHVASRKAPQFWRRASMIGRSAGIDDPARLERALQDAATAGLVERRISHGLVKLTADGRGLGG